VLKEIKTVKAIGKIELTIKKSKFIATVKHVETEKEALELLEEVRSQHKTAAHNVYAYQIGDNNEIQRYNDDGEPHGTAGPPILDLIKREDLKNTIVIVTRYFGGILLGTGGLVRAYTQGALQGIKDAIVCYRVHYIKYSLEFDYSFLGKIQNSLMQNNYLIEGLDYGEKVNMIIPVRYNYGEKFYKDIIELSNGKVIPREIAQGFLMETDGKGDIGSWKGC
jgi:uncharacterized YigZ family protein